MGLDMDAYLNNNDSYGFFNRTGNLIKTGPTGTNLMDLYMLLTGPLPGA
jgi:glycerate 2-kinase